MWLKTIATMSALLSGLAKTPDPEPARVATAQAERLTANEVVTKVQKFYENTQHLTAKFRQIYTNETFGREDKSDGIVYVSKPGKMRWDYKQGKTLIKSFISDGKQLWAVEYDNKQVFKKNLEDNLLPVAITFLYGKGDLSAEFNPSLDSGKFGVAKADYLLKLVPKKPTAQYKTLWLVVDGTNYRVKQSIVLEDSGNTNHFKFFSPDTKSPVKDSWFFFDEAKYAKTFRIIDSDEEEKKAKAGQGKGR